MTPPRHFSSKTSNFNDTLPVISATKMAKITNDAPPVISFLYQKHKEILNDAPPVISKYDFFKQNFHYRNLQSKSLFSMMALRTPSPERDPPVGQSRRKNVALGVTGDTPPRTKLKVEPFDRSCR